MRVGVILLILSDAMFVGSQFAAAGYLRVLNTNHAYKGPHEAASSFLWGLVLSLLAVLAALAFFWGQREWKAGKHKALRTGNLIATVLILVALAGQIALLASSHYVGTADDPFAIDAFASSNMFINAYHCVHLFIAALVGVLMMGRISNHRIEGHEYILEAVGFWWQLNVAIISVVTWLLIAAIV